MKLFTLPYILVKPLQKGKNDGHLIPVKKMVTKKGVPFEETYYVRPGDVKNKHLKAGQTFRIHDKEGVGIHHRGKHFSIVKPDEKKKGHFHVRYEGGEQGIVHEKHILKHSTPIEGKRLPEKKAIEGPKRNWTAKLPHLPQDTSAFWKRKGQGDYPPERKALHEKIISEYLDHVPVSEDEKPLAYLMAGGTAAGKSTVLRHMMSEDDSNYFVMVDPDGIKEKLPEYQEATKGSAKNAAVMVHEESSYIAKELRKRAIQQGKPVIIDGTMKDPIKYGELMKDLKKKGYGVNVVMVDVDIDQAIDSAKKRAERTGRHVPSEIIRDIYPQSRKSFLHLKDLADDYRVYDRRSGTPSLVWSKEKGILDHHAVNTIFGG